MSNEEKIPLPPFLKILDKAVKNGYKIPKGHCFGIDGKVTLPSKYEIIFSHDFAKAFWGEKKIEGGAYSGFTLTRGWQYHLQQMVLAKEPLKYLEKFLK